MGNRDDRGDNHAEHKQEQSPWSLKKRRGGSIRLLSTSSTSTENAKEAGVLAELRSRPQLPSSMHFEQNDERSVTVVSVLAETQRI